MARWLAETGVSAKRTLEEHLSHRIELLQRLFVQIERILKIGGPSVISNDVVEAARNTLVIGMA